jgi:hypothetical protein
MIGAEDEAAQGRCVISARAVQAPATGHQQAGGDAELSLGSDKRHSDATGHGDTYRKMCTYTVERHAAVPAPMAEVVVR